MSLQIPPSPARRVLWLVGPRALPAAGGDQSRLRVPLLRTVQRARQPPINAVTESVQGLWSLSVTHKEELDEGVTTEPALANGQLSRFAVLATVAGRWCLASISVEIAGLVAMVVAFGTGQEGGETFTDIWWISGPALVAAFGIVGAFPTGLFAVVRQHERSALVILAPVIGASVALLVIGEISTPPLTRRTRGLLP